MKENAIKNNYFLAEAITFPVPSYRTKETFMGFRKGGSRSRNGHKHSAFKGFKLFGFSRGPFPKLRRIVRLQTEEQRSHGKKGVIFLI
jgi:hypothetical protein